VNPEFRKVALIAAVLGLLVSLFVALQPDDDEGTGAATTTPALTAPKTIGTEPETDKIQTEPAPPATTATETAPAPDEPVTIRIAVPGDTAPTVRKLSVSRGRRVELVVESELADHVHLHGYDLTAAVGPGRTGRIAFAADAPGRFEVELEDRHLAIAELEVRP
jgi:pyruvate/2-oxoglutarate dehydrogenase complex dihydrolipoamide acyltransferase (E2) component